MTLKEARVRFSFLVAERLLPKARELGFEYAFDDVMVKGKVGHMANSLHYSGCAIDLILYKDGVYQIKTEEYKELVKYWESLDPDCKWGGGWGDGNHMSYAPIELFGGRK